MNYLIDNDTLYRMTYAKRKALKQNTGETDFIGFAVKVIAERLQQKPQQYIEYGVYWWALKNVLAKHGYLFGDENDQELQQTYQHEKDDYTIVAADNFKDEYRNKWFKGTREFDLADDRKYHLLDADMETLAL